MCRSDVDAEVGDQPGEARHLALRQFHDQAREGGRVDDRVLQWAFQAAADQPGVECVVTVLHEHRAMGKAQESTPGILEHGRADKHGAIDVVPPFRVRVDGRPAVDERVEERERALQRETLRAQLEHEERRVAGRLDVEGDELRLVERRQRTHFGRVDRDLLPGHERGGSARFQIERLMPLVGTHRAMTSARRAHAISSMDTARSRSTAIT
jgi:hypothetical protein